MFIPSNPKYSTDVAQARSVLTGLAAHMREQGQVHYAYMLDCVVSDLMTRRKVVFRTKNQSHRITPELKAAIKQARFNNPGLTQTKIANMYNVNQGRVAECIAPRDPK